MTMTVSFFLISSINRSFAEYIGKDFWVRRISSFLAPSGGPRAPSRGRFIPAFVPANFSWKRFLVCPTPTIVVALALRSL
jgi:hypothetical protein